MCGRYGLHRALRELQESLDVDLVHVEDRGPRYNIAPTQAIAVLRLAGPKRVLSECHWGFPRPGGGRTRVINAKAERLLESPMWRGAVAAGRVVVPADHFYEWQTQPGGKQPYAVKRRDGGLLLMAGLAKRLAVDGAPMDVAAIVTTRPNTVMAEIHDRMPALLDPDAASAWIDGHTVLEEAVSLLGPCASMDLDVFPVSSLVNDVRNDGQRLMEAGPRGSRQGTLDDGAPVDARAQDPW